MKKNVKNLNKFFFAFKFTIKLFKILSLVKKNALKMYS